MTKKRKNTRGWVVDVDDELYKTISVKSADEGWKVATLLRKFLRKLAHGDEAAEYIRDAPDDE